MRKGAPPVIDYLCEECRVHFDSLRKHLDILHVPHLVNPSLVRGLDYYTRTAFEVSSSDLGSQSAVAAGGRYDRMVDEFGGPPSPGIGFAMGMERIIPLIRESSIHKDNPDILFCPMGDDAAIKCLVIAEELRGHGLRVEINFGGASIRSQMRKANRTGARHVIVIGDDELNTGRIVIKNMNEGVTAETNLDADGILHQILK